MEEPLDEHLHPNWVALATVKFKPKIFVKSSGTEDQQVRRKIEIAVSNEDDSSSRAYCEILESPSTAILKGHEITKKPGRRRRKVEQIQFDAENLFKLAMQDKAEEIRQMMQRAKSPNVNATDAYGWTALMMAACEGSVNSFEVLLNFGADLTIYDRKGNTAKSLAEKKDFQEILQIIKKQSKPIEISDDEEEDEDQGTLFCSDCGIEIAKSSSKSHQTSTVHLFSCKFKGNDNIKAFGISRSNLGFQMMRRTGWDGNSALGARQNGKLYPIRTVIRKRNTGLGIKQGPSKVTHFKANDTSAVHFRPPPRALTRREIHENDLKDKRHEQRLRRELT